MENQTSGLNSESNKSANISRDQFTQKIDFNSPIAYYFQLIIILKSKIEQGFWKPGEKLPSTSEFCELFEVSRTVVRQALQELEYENLIYTRKGKGSFVATPKISESLAKKVTGFYQDMQSQGRHPKTKILDFSQVPADTKIAQFLEVEPGDIVYKITRLRYIDNEPIVFDMTYLSRSLCGCIEDTDLSENSLYECLENCCGLVLSHGRRWIEAVSANEYIAGLMGIEEGLALVKLESITFLKNNSPVEYYRAFHRGDRLRFEVDVVRLEGNKQSNMSVL